MRWLIGRWNDGHNDKCERQRILKMLRQALLETSTVQE